ncbi:MAG: hypothetical protein L6282_01930 [Candidatus Methanoperedenaceae archaeon]|nr:hypothetical protein [Candidatus Methanoperedenaceae archaeon]
MTVGIIRTGNSTSIGVVTTKTLISPSSGLFMPSDAKALLAVKPVLASALRTTVESTSVRLDIESADIKGMSPFEVLFAPVGAGLGITFSTFSGKSPEYRINAALGGGDSVNVYGTALVNNSTTAPEAMAYIVVSNDARDLQGQIQKHAKLGTMTTAGVTTDTDVAGTKYSFSGGRRITELIGLFHPVVIAANDALVGGIKYTSSEFVDSIPQELPLFPFMFGLGATGSVLIPGVSRQRVNIPVKSGQVNIQDYLNCGLLPASAGKFIDGVIYE